MSDLEAQGGSLVTFALLAYNQAAYIGEAIAGAFAQTYSPLEIILSDDCSSDRTFEIMRTMTEAYKGPHVIRLNKNAVNAGIGGHCQKLFSLMKGEYIVLAAGDDISLPTRTETLVRHFVASTGVKAVFSNINLIDETSTTIGTNKPSHLGGDDPPTLRKLAENGGGVGLGATYSYARECLFWPSEYPGRLMNEDRILPFRAAILGKVVHIPQGLVSYRLTKDGVSRSLTKKALWVTRKVEHMNELETIITCARREGRLGFFVTLDLRLTMLTLSTKGRLLDAEEGSNLAGTKFFYRILIRLTDFVIYRRGRLQRILDRFSTKPTS